MGKTRIPTKKTAEKTAKTSPLGPKKQLPALVARTPDAVPQGGGHAKISILPPGIELIRDMAARGCSQPTIRRALGIGNSAWQRILKEQEEVGEAYRSGKAEEEDYLVSLLRQAADKGNIISAMFLLKSRHGYVEGAPPDTARTNVTIVLPDALSEEAYLRSIRVEQLPANKDAVDA